MTTVRGEEDDGEGERERERKNGCSWVGEIGRAHV